VTTEGREGRRAQESENSSIPPDRSGRQVVSRSRAHRVKQLDLAGGWLLGLLAFSDEKESADLT